MWTRCDRPPQDGQTASPAAERAATVMLSASHYTLSTTKPSGRSQRLDMNAAMEAILPADQREPPGVIESAPEPYLDADSHERTYRFLLSSLS